MMDSDELNLCERFMDLLKKLNPITFIRLSFMSILRKIRGFSFVAAHVRGVDDLS